MASSSYVDDNIHPDESFSQINVDEDIDDDIYGEQETALSVASLSRSSQLTSTTTKKRNIFYVRNEFDKIEAATLLKVSSYLILLMIG